MKIYIAMIASLVTVFANPCIGFAQETAEEEVESQVNSDQLTIGSVAPELDIEHWVQDGDGKFKAVTKFEDGKVYMVEFWATWCGPCIASMPHLSELQQKYADEGLQIVSVSDEDLETVEEFLERDVRGEDEMTYNDLTKNWCLTTDPDGSVQNDYMRAAGQNGIPTAFIVGKTGHVEWIGHPMEVDQPVSAILNDEWDREDFASTFRAKQEVEMLLQSLGAKMQAGLSDEVIADLNEAIENSDNDDIIKQLSSIRAQVIVSTGAEGAADAIRELTESMGENANGLNNMAWGVVELHDAGSDVDEDLVAAAVAAAEKAIKLDPEAGHIIDTLAHLVHMQGDLDRAIELTEKAVELSGDEFPEMAEFLEELRKEKAGTDDDEKDDGEDEDDDN